MLDALKQRGFEVVAQRENWAFRYNIRLNAVEWKEKPNNNWTALDDPEIARLQQYIGEHYTFGPAGKPLKEMLFKNTKWFREVILASAYAPAFGKAQRIDPFLKWLEEECPASSWDNKPRIRKLFQTVLCCADDEFLPLAEWAGIYLIVGAIQRAREPGCVLQEIPVLRSVKKGSGKSAISKCLLPSEFQRDYLQSNFKYEPNNTNKNVEGVLKSIFVEFSELNGLTKNTLNSLKAFLTTQVDNTRLAWAHTSQAYPRRSVIYGTTNDVFPFPDDAGGHRRFVLIDCPGPTQKQVAEAGFKARKAWVEHMLESHVVNERKQLWAEAQTLYNMGVRANIPANIMHLQDEYNKTHTHGGDLAERIKNLGFTGLVPKSRVYSNLSMGDSLGRRTSKDEQNALYAAMDSLGLKISKWPKQFQTEMPKERYFDFGDGTFPDER